MHMTKACCIQAGPAHATGYGDGMDIWHHSSHLFYMHLLLASIVL